MDKSVDSIGSCSLDIDGESTDFSDNSGSLIITPTPLCATDFTHEFTTCFRERCQIVAPRHLQQTSTVFDKNSGQINTLISTKSDSIDNFYTVVSQEKKPSYLNLACCVNGYSNLTKYDSKLRQNINRSREVSPIRPLTNIMNYNRELSSGQHLLVPVPKMMNDNKEANHNVVKVQNRLSTSVKTSDFDKCDIIKNQIEFQTLSDNITSKEVEYLKNQKHEGESNNFNDQILIANCSNDKEIVQPKSFIQQRVERLYGPGALAQGFYSPQRNKYIKESKQSIFSNQYKTSIDHTDSTSFEMPEKVSSIANYYTSNSLSYSTFTTQNVTKKTITESKMFKRFNNINESESTITSPSTLPVLRHLRPEFRAQLKMTSPKRIPPQLAYNGISSLSKEPTFHQTELKQTDENCLNIIRTTDTSEDRNLSLFNSYDKLKESKQSVNIVTSKSVDNSILSKPAIPMLSLSTEDNVDCALQQIRLTDTIRPLNSGTNSLKNIQIVSTQNHKDNISSDNVKVTDASLSNDNIKTDIGTASKETVTKDGAYFLNILTVQRNRLISLAEQVERDIELLSKNSNLPDEEIVGMLRSAAGKGKLLASQKMQQFEGLCHKNINQIPGEKFPTTNEDLQGFWDMVMLQVVQVDDIFKEIDVLRLHNWQRMDNLVQPNSQNPESKVAIDKTKLPNYNGKGCIVSDVKKSATGASQRREAQRKKLLEFKRKNKQAMLAADSLQENVINGNGNSNNIGIVFCSKIDQVDSSDRIKGINDKIDQNQRKESSS